MHEKKLINAPRILHFSSVRKLSAGQRKQLEYEVAASMRLEQFSWDTLAIQKEKPQNAFEKQVPIWFRFIFARNLYAWFSLMLLKSKYDYVIFRHVPFDPFVFLFAPFFKNRITIHHSKEIEEMVLIRKGWKGLCASYLERLAGRFSIRRALGVLGVTNEIAEYEVKRAMTNLPFNVYPNAIDVGSMLLAGDHRSENSINVAFICGTFMPWHGLDLLVKEVESNLVMCRGYNLKIHIVGALSQEQERLLLAIDPDNSIFEYHGYLTYEKYSTILAKCDLGLGSLAMYRQNLNEGATLKVRELLAMGIPVYSGHRDALLPDNFAYYKFEELSLVSLFNFALRTKSVTRCEVRELSAPFIDKLDVMNATANWLQSLGNRSIL